MEGTSSVDNATSAEDMCKGEALVADLFSIPEGTGPQRDNAEGVSKGEVADPIVMPEGAGPQGDKAPSEVAAGPQGDKAPLKAGSSTSSTSGETPVGEGAATAPELLAPAEASSEGRPLPKRRIARARASRLMFFHAGGAMSGGRVVETAR